MSLPKPLTLRHLCHLLNNILGYFYHRHIVFFSISLVKNTKSFLREVTFSIFDQRDAEKDDVTMVKITKYVV